MVPYCSLFNIFFFLSSVCVLFESKNLPNIIFILADDLGYGDIKSYNLDRGNISTIHIDAIGKNGMSFMDAHSSSSVCTPSRYSIMTGRYNWRSKLKEGVLEGLGRPLIPRKRSTVGTVLKNAGYKTAFVGKWHLGLNISFHMDGVRHNPFWGPSKNEWASIDWQAKVDDGPVALGFDHYFGIAASLDMAPYVFIEDDHFRKRGEMGRDVDWGRQGPVEPNFDPEMVLGELTTYAKNFLRKNLNGKQPVFLYLSLTSPHTPVRPDKVFKGQSNVGWYGDFVMQSDDIVGQMVQELKSAGVYNNTIVIFTSDNGFTNAGMNNGPRFSGKHWPSAHWRGSKADIWDGGHRIPFLIQWPDVIPAGSVVKDSTISLTDMFATFVDITNTSSLVDSTHGGEDSFSILPLLTGKGTYTRNETIVHSILGKFAIREGKWFFALCAGSGGWSAPKDNQVHPRDPQYQLYDMEKDPSQKVNLLTSHPGVAEALKAKLHKIRSQRRSNERPVYSNSY